MYNATKPTARLAIRVTQQLSIDEAFSLVSNIARRCTHGACIYARSEPENKF